MQIRGERFCHFACVGCCLFVMLTRLTARLGTDKLTIVQYSIFASLCGIKEKQDAVCVV